MVPPSIRQIISAALRSENATHQLRSRLERQLPQLQHKLLLPEREPITALMTFITGYVESVPSCLRPCALPRRRR